MFLLMKVLSLTTPSSEMTIFDSNFQFLSRSSDLNATQFCKALVFSRLSCKALVSSKFT